MRLLANPSLLQFPFPAPSLWPVPYILPLHDLSANTRTWQPLIAGKAGPAIAHKTAGSLFAESRLQGFLELGSDLGGGAG